MITVTRYIHCDLPVCIIVFIQWCIGMRNCADVLQMTTTLPPRSRRQSCPRRSMFEVHLRLKGLSVFLICFPFYHRPTLLHRPAMCFVLRLPRGIVHLDALSRIFIASTVAAATDCRQEVLITASFRHEPGENVE